MTESPNSRSRKLQFRIICIVMVTCVVYSVISSGSLRPVEVKEGVFPGGEFVYKSTGRDYAASMSMVMGVAKDLGVKESEYGNTMYTVYLDDPLVVNGRRQRFAGGILLNEQTVTVKQETNEERRRILMGKNADIKDPSPKEVEELAAYELWPRLKYAALELPSVKAAVVEYTFTNGFVSALLHSYKVSLYSGKEIIDYFGFGQYCMLTNFPFNLDFSQVFPTIRKYAKEHGAPGMVPVVVTTCSIPDSKCTHYVVS